MRAPRLDAVSRALEPVAAVTEGLATAGVNEIASSGFGAAADAYQRARPSYPPEAVDWVVDALRISAGTRVADVAAGTGKFTELIVPRGAELVAVEPVEGMRRVFAASVPSVRIVAALAERMPFCDASFDAITVAQAFHWFDAGAALHEFARVLRHGGRIALLWYGRDLSVAWLDALWSIIGRLEKPAPWSDPAYVTETWERLFAESPWFTSLTSAAFHYEHLLSRDDMIERIRSISLVAALPDDAQEELLDEARAVIDHHPESAGREQLVVPYRVGTYRAERR